jgi:hypothetical protein
MCRHAHGNHAKRHADWAARIEGKIEEKRQSWASRCEAKQEKWANRCEAKRQRWAAKCQKHMKQPEQPVEPPTEANKQSTVRQIPVNGYIRPSMSRQTTSASDEKAKLAEREKALGADPPSYGSQRSFALQKQILTHRTEAVKNMDGKESPLSKLFWKK